MEGRVRRKRSVGVRLTLSFRVFRFAWTICSHKQVPRCGEHSAGGLDVESTVSAQDEKDDRVGREAELRWLLDQALWT